MLGKIGLPELLVLLAMGLFLFVPVVAVASVIWFLRFNHKSLPCPHCGKRIKADRGVCPVCGKRV